MDKNIPLHEKIRFLRLKNNITQDVAAEELYISRACLSNYERGLRTPGVETLSVMEKYYNAEPGYLFPEKYGGSQEFIKLCESAGGKCDKLKAIMQLHKNINISRLSVSSVIAIGNFCEYLSYCNEKNNNMEGEDKNDKR